MAWSQPDCGAGRGAWGRPASVFGSQDPTGLPVWSQARHGVSGLGSQAEEPLRPTASPTSLPPVAPGLAPGMAAGASGGAALGALAEGTMWSPSVLLPLPPIFPPLSAAGPPLAMNHTGIPAIPAPVEILGAAATGWHASAPAHTLPPIGVLRDHSVLPPLSLPSLPTLLPSSFPSTLPPSPPPPPRSPPPPARSPPPTSPSPTPAPRSPPPPPRSPL